MDGNDFKMFIRPYGDDSSRKCPFFIIAAGLWQDSARHDWSKFSPMESVRACAYYNGSRSPSRAARRPITAVRWPGCTIMASSNLHHYEARFRQILTMGRPTDMTYPYAVEMICDFGSWTLMGVCPTYEGCRPGGSVSRVSA